MNILQKLTDEFSLKPWQVENTVKLIDDETLFLLLQDTEKKSQALA